MTGTSAPRQAYARQHHRPEKDNTTKAVLTVGSIVTAVIAVFLLLSLCVFHLWVIPRFIEIFQDFDTQLPALTIFLVGSPALVFLAVYGLGIVALIAKECIPPLHGSIKLGLNLLVIVLCLVMYVVYFLGLQLPMFQLMDSMM
ncbi:MAG: hypothetical protein KTR15_04315 [Phycisphaeraceae bacterium]|nr:hypothetical protein [Phycisphaeraceae bacterium]